MQEILKFNDSLANDFEINVTDGIITFTDNDVEFKFNISEWETVKQFIDRQFQ